MFEKEAKERARDFTDNEGRQVAYECGFLDGADRMRAEMQKLEEDKCELLGIIQGKDKAIKELEKLKNKNKALEMYADLADEKIDELKEKLAGAERTRDNLRQIGFPTFQSCKEYADKMNYAKAIIKDLLDNSDEYARQRAIDFLKEV